MVSQGVSWQKDLGLFLTLKSPFLVFDPAADHPTWAPRALLIEQHRYRNRFARQNRLKENCVYRSRLLLQVRALDRT